MRKTQRLNISWRLFYIYHLCKYHLYIELALIRHSFKYSSYITLANTSTNFFWSRYNYYAQPIDGETERGTWLTQFTELISGRLNKDHRVWLQIHLLQPLYFLVVLVAKSCRLFCNFMNCRLQAHSVIQFPKARTLEWTHSTYSGGLPNPGIESIPPALAGGLSLSHQEAHCTSYISLCFYCASDWISFS